MSYLSNPEEYNSLKNIHLIEVEKNKRKVADHIKLIRAQEEIKVLKKEIEKLKKQKIKYKKSSAFWEVTYNKSIGKNTIK